MTESSGPPGQPRNRPLGRGALWLAALSLAAVIGCDRADTDLDAGGAVDAPTTPADASTTPGLDPDLLLADGLVRAVSMEECTLSGGTVTTCYRITVSSLPTDHDIGPFCPRSITDGADVSGIWFEGGEVYDVDGSFIEGLATFYDDDNWLLYDPATGLVNVTDTQAACEGAARPDVDPAYQNHCVECDVAYVGDDTVATYVIPAAPVRAAVPNELGMNVVGLALNGVNFDPPAPTAAILAAYTIAALDDCGGHVNPVTGYHYHAATGCTETDAQEDGHAPLLGYALDGHGIYAMAADGGDEPTDLDACRAHTDSTRGYHYHVASPGENLFIGCFGGEVGCHVEGSSDEYCDATLSTGPPGPPGPPGGGG